MQKLQIYTHTEQGPSIELQFICNTCKYLKDVENEDCSSIYFVCQKTKTIIGDNFITPNNCPLLNTEKVNAILNAVEDYIKV